MDDFNESMHEIKLLMFNAIESENIGNKLETYRKYIKGMSELFNVLNKDLENYSTGDDVYNLKLVSQKHLSMLKSASHSVTRSIEQLVELPIHSKVNRQASGLELASVNALFEYKSMPSKKSIDYLISEKPMNPIDFAKFNLQNMVKNTNKLLQSPKLSATQRISVQLQLNREIEETLSIARKREEDICKVKTNDLELLQKKIDNDISQYSILSSKSDLKELYRSSLLFYHHILKGSKWYELAKLDRCPESSCLMFILRMNDNHPIVMYIDKIIEQLLSNKNDKDTIDVVMSEIKKFMEKIQDLSKACCLIGNFNSSERNSNSVQGLFGILCDFIFAKAIVADFIYNFLFISDEILMNQFNINVKLIQEMTNESIILPEKFNRHPSIKEIIDEQTLQLSTLRTVYNPINRLSKLCQIVRDLMSIITEKNPKIEIGADELVPILSYMMIKFGGTEICLHIKYLEILMPGDYMIGMEGYILVSVCCAMAFCTSDKFESYLSINKS